MAFYLTMFLLPASIILLSVYLAYYKKPNR